jgi:hypothetical protein
VGLDAILRLLTSQLFQRFEARGFVRMKSDAVSAIHETMTALHEIGAIDKQTIRRFDDACLTPVQSTDPSRIATTN